MRLRQHYLVAPLSNGNISLLVDLARHADLHWDCVLSAELAKRYKTDTAPYLYAAELLGLQPEQVMMVAAHNSDLDAARSVGFRTAFVLRNHEHGSKQSIDLAPNTGMDITASNLNDLADQLTGRQ